MNRQEIQNKTAELKSILLKYKSELNLGKINLEVRPSSTRVQVVARLEDSYFLKTDQGKYFFLSPDLLTFLT